MIVISRHITDLSIDCNGILCLTYIFWSPAKIKGILSSCYQLMTTFGIMTTFLLGLSLLKLKIVRPDNILLFLIFSL
jgi:hypothetical protein